MTRTIVHLWWRTINNHKNYLLVDKQVKYLLFKKAQDLVFWYFYIFFYLMAPQVPWHHGREKCTKHIQGIFCVLRFCTYYSFRILYNIQVDDFRHQIRVVSKHVLVRNPPESCKEQRCWSPPAPGLSTGTMSSSCLDPSSWLLPEIERCDSYCTQTSDSTTFSPGLIWG